MRTIALVQSRMASQRFPGKVLADACGRPLLSHLLARIATAETLDHIVVATGDNPANEPIIALCQREDWDYYVGSEDDVLSRLYEAGRYANADAIVRVTGDCPLHDGAEVDRVVRFAWERRYQYASNCHPPALPDGIDTEFATMQALGWLAMEATSASDCEHTTPLLRRRLSRFWWGSIGHTPNLAKYRLTVDTPADLAAMRAILSIAGVDCSWREAVKVLEEHPEIAALNQRPELRNAAYVSQRDEESKKA